MLFPFVPVIPMTCPEYACKKRSVWDVIDRFRLDAAGYTPARLVLIADELRPLQPNIMVR